MRRFLAVTALAVTTVLAPASPAVPAPGRDAAPDAVSEKASEKASETVSEKVRVARESVGGLARQIAKSLAEPQARQRLFAATSAGPADLLTVLPMVLPTVLPAVSPEPASLAGQVNRQLLAAKGLPAEGGSILRIRLANPGLPGLRGEPLVAVSPDDDTTTIVAYDSRAEVVHLDAVARPLRPVFVVEVDTERSVELGLAVLQRELAARGVLARPAAQAASGYWATKITAVRLRDDEEPWIKGAAEIFSVVGGWGLDGVATASVVQMPYLDHDGTTYYPNQLVAHFNAYKYNLADIVMMEDDGDTNYQQLAIAIANALLSLVDGGVYAPLVTAILNAIPASWWTDDPDYVDSWYTLATSSTGRLNGAAANGWMDVVPYWVQPL